MTLAERLTDFTAADVALGALVCQEDANALWNQAHLAKLIKDSIQALPGSTGWITGLVIEIAIRDSKTIKAVTHKIKLEDGLVKEPDAERVYVTFLVEGDAGVGCASRLESTRAETQKLLDLADGELCEGAIRSGHGISPLVSLDSIGRSSGLSTP
ncbi:hypothetical protein S-CBS2_gp094 [Synechococcus phage S-CBS2]|uniref:hypothetical protein n=1 Tax=Synechococcus phage S-CBS2 TaxID=753084 RepID=UPI000207843C|nr:hypothetical protein S-CBS2_gp094 [Synechococcus phage S-CBS2]ADF42450.1 hypothetical protein S-CBS2_gp094 [Synechococcus phage S-CBS2]